MTARIALAIAAAAALAGCGDDLHPVEDGSFAARSGARLTLQKYRYDDGTELAVSTEFYDTQLHTRCTPQAWPDGAVRCAPSADDAEYADPACTMRIGLGRTIEKPTFFVAPDTAAGGAVATRVFRAGAAIPPVAQYYTLAAGVCTGPIAVPATLDSFFAIGGELAGAALVAFHDTEIAAGRLGLVVRETDDGLRVATGLRDRQLGAACAATSEADGSVACEPAGAAAAIFFGDPACDQPVVAAASAPAVARLVEPSGCASYHSVGPERSPPVYRRTGDACSPADAPTGRMFGVGPPIALPAIGRTLEDAPGRRLRRTVLDLGSGLRTFGDRLFDTALGADCQPRTLRNLIRCVPVAVTPATVVFTAGCTSPVLVAEVPQHACDPPAFATSSRPFQIRPIGAVAPGPLFRFEAAACTPYAGAPGNELRSLGAPIDPTTLVGAIYYGERSL
ncbi:MAG TPA: hypothetical protein VHW23_45220 [Kofleriaceae bacterium]|jgi:hypothetical protein|nr:hypothetical protein [Kofleriaceae bacterium]